MLATAHAVHVPTKYGPVALGTGFRASNAIVQIIFSLVTAKGLLKSLPTVKRPHWKWWLDVFDCLMCLHHLFTTVVRFCPASHNFALRRRREMSPS